MILKNLLLIISLFFLLSCSRSEQLPARLSAFTGLLSETEIKLFEENNLQPLRELLEKKYSTDADFKKKLDRLKHEECINLFSIQQTLEYYRQNFIKKK
ncbi:MAG TPA: hypothetical protein DC049_10875 [Spirochaetia bacterium]|nr:hypothetical protein [Spirochaetia bacterium]